MFETINEQTIKGSTAFDGKSLLSMSEELAADGFSVVKGVLNETTCDALIHSYDKDELYRSTIKMERYSFGKGEYRYFSYPLPDPVSHIRTSLYPGLSEIANSWNSRLGICLRYPDTHDAFVVECHSAGQIRPTPLILKYREGDYNCLHQDLYGELHFPLQMAVMLSDPETDFEGGEFILTEQRPRMQSKASVVPLKKGDAVIFPVNERPVKGNRGYYRVKMRHGVSKLLNGERYVLGVIFHDAK